MGPTSQRRLPLMLIAIATVLLALRIVSIVMRPGGEDESSRVKWVPVEQAFSLAQSTNRPMLFDFTAEWCPPCHVLDAEIFQNPEMAREINARFIPVRVLDRQQEEGQNTPAVAGLQQRYNVRGFPTVVVSDRNGNELGRMEGFRGRGEFQRVMEQAR